MLFRASAEGVTAFPSALPWQALKRSKRCGEETWAQGVWAGRTSYEFESFPRLTSSLSLPACLLSRCPPFISLLHLLCPSALPFLLGFPASNLPLCLERLLHTVTGMYTDV